MSDEVLPSSVPMPAEAGEPPLASVDGPKSSSGRGFPLTEPPLPNSRPANLTNESERLAAANPGLPEPLPQLSVEPLLSTAAAPMVPAVTLPAPAFVPAEVLPRAVPASELAPSRPSERPPPPSQRPRLAAAAAAAPSAGTLPDRSAAHRLLTPLPISVTTSLPPAARPSEPVPLVKRSMTSTPMPPARISTLPPGLVEPKRIIEVIGSNVPVLDSQLEDDLIEDLDDSEAHELSEAGEAGREPGADFEVSVDFDDPPHDDPAHDDESPDAEADSRVGAEEGTEPAEPGAAPRPGAAPQRRVKAPPNRRKRPPPPSARASEKARAELERLDKTDPAPGTRKWWEEMFSEEFLRAIPILSPRQLQREVDFIDEGLAVARGGRILDLACGAGQHAVELASRGYDVLGYDLSQSQLDWASGLAQERGQRLQFTHGDMRELAYQDSFDAVYCWNTSFGFFEEEKNFDVAQRVFKSLRPGGRFLLDVVNRDFVVSQQPGQTWFEGDGCVCIDDVTLDFITSRMKVKRTLMLTNGKNRECTYSVRIYGLHELGKMLHDVGFKILKVSGRPEMPGVFFGSTSPRILILASKPPA